MLLVVLVLLGAGALAASLGGADLPLAKQEKGLHVTVRLPPAPTEEGTLFVGSSFAPFWMQCRTSTESLPPSSTALTTRTETST